ncbi:TQXA domain-containing protein [Streptomyces sp. JNUCC 64]
MFAVISPVKRGVVRLAVGVTVSGLVTVGMVTGAPVAVAEEDPRDQGGAVATLTGLKLAGEAVVRVGDEERRVQAGLFEMAVDGGGTLRTYGVDLDMATQWDARYQESAWADTSLGANASAGEIRWILQNSYPQVNDLATLARRAGAKGLTEQDAAVGTQVAIWRHSDGSRARVARDEADGRRGSDRDVPRVTATDPQAERLADYLERKARAVPEPGASLRLDRPEHSTLLPEPGSGADAHAERGGTAGKTEKARGEGGKREEEGKRKEEEGRGKGKRAEEAGEKDGPREDRAGTGADAKPGGKAGDTEVDTEADAKPGGKAGDAKADTKADAKPGGETGGAKAGGKPGAARDGGVRVGPVTVRSGGERVTVAPDPAALTHGVRIVDGAGDPVTTAGDGDRLYFALPEGVPAGSAGLTAQTSTTVPVGRAFVSGSRSQTQVLAGSSESTVSATATVNWADSGPVPAVSVRKVCAERRLDVTVRNAGDEEFTVELMGTSAVIGAGRTETVPVSLVEDQSYDFTVTGPHDYEKRISGILDCRTRSGEATGTRTMTAPSSASKVGGPRGTGAPRASDLAATGGSAATPLIAGTAVGLVVIGGAVILVLRSRNRRREG